jgi:uncharacterized protein GlcG (DUF336 family)
VKEMKVYKTFGILFSFIITFGHIKTLAADAELVTFQSMNLELAQMAAMETLKACRDEGYQVSVAVVDRSGGIQVLIRDQLAGIFTTDIATRKARTALSFHTDTINLVEPTKSGEVASGIRDFPDAMIVAGGVRIEAAGSIVGSIGVSGAPGPEIDDVCARKGIEKIDDILNF